MRSARTALLKPGVLFALFATCAWGGRQFEAMPGDAVRERELIVRSKTGDLSGVASLLPRGTITQPLRISGAYRLQFSAPPSADLARALAAHDSIAYVEPNHLRSTAVIVPSDPIFSSQWALSSMRAHQAWTLMPNRYFTSTSTPSSRVRVAVLDSGIDCTHPDFKNAGGSSTNSSLGGQLNWTLSQVFAPINPDVVPSPACAWQDDNGHGTHVSGIMAAATNNATGVAALAFPLEVVTFKVLSTDGTVDDATLADAIVAAADTGVRVISMSLAGPGFSQVLQDSLDYCWSKNIVVVVAKGNNSNSGIYYPSDGNHAVGVAAIQTGNVYASFSNRGLGVDISAPGASVWSTTPTYPVPTMASNYASLTGTSMATPHVAALAGLLAWATPQVANDALVQRIQRSADSSVTNGGWSDTLGYGWINAEKALSGAQWRNATTGAVTGQVQDSAGVTIEGATVEVGSQSTVTGTHGLFRFANLAPGDHTLSISATGFPDLTLTVAVVAGADTPTHIRLGSAYGTLQGTVTAGGLSAVGAVVQALQGGLVKGVGVANAAGTYRIAVPSGVYDVRASASFAAPMTATGRSVTAGGTTTVALTLTPMGRFVGTVTGSGGAPIAGEIIVKAAGVPAAGATTDASGAFATIGLASGAYDVAVAAAGYSTSTQSGLTIVGGTDTNVQFQLGSPVLPVIQSLTLTNAFPGGGATVANNRVVLQAPAPTGGAVIALASANPAVASVPPSVTITAGQTTGYFAITTSRVSAKEVVLLTASLENSVKTATITVSPTGLQYLSAPASLPGGQTLTGFTIYLNGPAGQGGFPVSLTTSDANAAAPPSSVTVPEGQSSLPVQVTTGNVASPTSVTFTAAANSSTRSVTTTVQPGGPQPGLPALVSITPGLWSVTGGTAINNNIVKLASAVPAGQSAVVTLASNNGAITTPPSVTVPAGASQATFGMSTSPVGANTNVAISASLAGVTKSTTVTVMQPIPSAVTVPTSIVGGNPASVTVRINGPAPMGGLPVVLTSDKPAVANPPSPITIPSGATETTVAVPTSAVTASTTVKISATAGGVTRTSSFTVAAPNLAGLTLAPSTVRGGTASTGTVTLTGRAPAGGITVTLSSNHASATAPPSVVVPAGATSAQFAITTSAVTSTVSAKISATLVWTVKQATLTVTP